MKKYALCAVIAFTELFSGPTCAETIAIPRPAIPGVVFKDCTSCPEMVVIPQGSFTMGSQDYPRERPEHLVTIDYFFAAGKYEVTFDEWDACLQDGGCNSYSPSDSGWGRGRLPAINISWDDAQTYISWLSAKTGRQYRLLTESEWEYIARAGTTTLYWWGNDYGNGQANCRNCGSQWDNKRQTAPVGSFPPNRFGVFDTVGNVTEWVEDRWNANYQGANTDGHARESGDPKRVVMRGGSWFNEERYQRSAFRNGDAPTVRNYKIGFRVATANLTSAAKVSIGTTQSTPTLAGGPAAAPIARSASVAVLPHPTSAPQNIVSGVAAHSLEKSVSELQSQVAKYPTNPNAWRQLGIAYRSVKAFDEAIRALGEASRLDDGSAQTWYELGATYYESGRTEKAREVFQEINKKDTELGSKYFQEFLLPR